MTPTPRRLPCDNFSFPLKIADASGEERRHALEISIARDPRDDRVREVVFVGRGRIGQGLDLMLHDLGIAISRAIQGRDPETGRAVE